MNARVKEPEPGHRFLSHSAPLPGPAEARGARSESTAPGWVNAPPKSCASPFSGPAAPPRAAAPGRGPSGHFGSPRAPAALARAPQTSAAGRQPRSSRAPSPSGRVSGGGGRAGPARGPLGFVVQTLWPPAAPPGRDWRQPQALSRKGKLMPGERTQLAQITRPSGGSFPCPTSVGHTLVKLFKGCSEGPLRALLASIPSGIHSANVSHRRSAYQAMW